MSKLFDTYSRLIMAGVLATLPEYLADDDEQLAAEMFAPEEQEVWRIVSGWRDYFVSKQRETESVDTLVFVEPSADEIPTPDEPVVEEAEQPTTNVSFATALKATIRAVIDEARRDLDALEERLDQHVPEDARAPRADPGSSDDERPGSRASGRPRPRP